MHYTHEHLEIQKTLKRFIDEEINPHVDEWEEAGQFPAGALFAKLGVRRTGDAAAIVDVPRVRRAGRGQANRGFRGACA